MIIIRLFLGTILAAGALFCLVTLAGIAHGS